VRQVAMIDAHGEVAAHTGKKCIPMAGDHVGDQYSVQANLMANDRVWPAMAKAYESTHGDLATRLLAALDAGQAAGGDIRGQQSAAIVIVKGKRSNKPWQDRIMDLRVEDSPKPIVELHRLVRLWRAYRNVDQGDAFVAQGKIPQALEAYAEGARLAPGNDEIVFWEAATLWQLGREQEAAPMFRKVFARDRRWLDLVPRLVPAGLLKDDPASIRRIQALAPPRTRTHR
jgi:tetratricopeptide (TPR) repeat protein